MDDRASLDDRRYSRDVLGLYGHPSERLARERIKRATAGKLSAVVSLPDAERRQS